MEQRGWPFYLFEEDEEKGLLTQELIYICSSTVVPDISLKVNIEISG